MNIVVASFRKTLCLVTSIRHQRPIYQEKLERLLSEIPPTALWLPILVIHIRSQVKIRKSQSYKFKKNAKHSNLKILQETLHTTHLLKLLDKIYEYKMDQTKTVGATEQTWDAGRMDRGTDRWKDRRTDRRMDGVKPIYTPPTTLLRGGYNYTK